MVNISRLNDPLLNPRIKVGTFHVPMTISNLATGESATVDALVDTRIMVSVAPASLLRELVVTSLHEQIFELTDGSTVCLPVGGVFITVQGQRVPTVCIFGPENIAPKLGAVVLATAGFTIDPGSLRLIPVPGLL